jgi:hypothetical protein
MIVSNGPIEIVALTSKDKKQHVVSVDHHDKGFGIFTIAGVEQMTTYCTKNDAVQLANWILAEAEKKK